jgi:hypothetical protein
VIERALVDYYRCPKHLVTVALAGDPSSDSGHFRFGTNVCYGQSSSGSRSSVLTDALHDTAPAVRAEAGVLRVPFDPSQVIDNLRLGRYPPGPTGFRRSAPDVVAEESLREAGTCWIALAGEVEGWWRQRSRMTLVQDGERWRIEGQGGERARIAWTVIHADQLIYRVEPASPSDTGASGT